MVEFIKPRDENKERDDKRKGSQGKRPRISIKSIILWIIIIFVVVSIIESIMFALVPKVKVFPVKGVIGTERSMSIYGETISSREISEGIYDAADDSSIKAIVLDINSGGGSPVASAEISKAIEYAKDKKKVVAQVNDMGASGAYWVAASADEIYVSPMSLVGSIGVTGSGLSFEEFIKEHNITYRRLVAGEHKDIGSPFRNMTSEEEKMLQGLLDTIHERFIDHVSQSRNLTYQETESLATGELYLGKEAKRKGLVDKTDYYHQVIKSLKNETGASIVVKHQPNIGLIEQLTMAFKQATVPTLFHRNSMISV